MSNTMKCGLAMLLAMIGFGGVFYPEGATSLHFAFEGSPNGDRPIIRPPAFYRADDGFGFVDSPELLGTSRGVMAPKYFRFDVNIPPGTYDVTVIIGGTQEESITSIKAEGGLPGLQDLRATRGQTATGTFTVTVKRGTANDKSPALDGCLNLEFVGTYPSLMKLTIKPSESAPATQPAASARG